MKKRMKRTATFVFALLLMISSLFIPNAVHAADNSQIWSIPLAGGSQSTPVKGGDGTIYVASVDGQLTAISPSGDVKWKYDFAPLHISDTPAIGSDGTIYIGTFQEGFLTDGNNSVGFLNALTPQGTLKWSVPTGAVVQSSPVLGNDGTIYIGSQNQKLYAIDPSGKTKWAYQTNRPIDMDPAIGPDGTIYVSGNAISSSGTLKWEVSGEIQNGSVANDGTVAFITQKGDLTLYTPDGKVKWTTERDSDLKGYYYDFTKSKPTFGRDGTVYVGSMYDHLFAFSSDGKLKWVFKTGYSVLGSPVVGEDGTVYTGSADGNVYAFTQDGTLKWALNLAPSNQKPNATSPNMRIDLNQLSYPKGILVDGDNLYVSCVEGSLYKINTNAVEKASGIGTVKGDVATDNAITVGQSFMVPNASVTVYDQNGNAVQKTQTDNQGFYSMQLPAGEYTIQATSQGASSTQRIYVSANEDNYVEIIVNPSAGKGKIYSKLDDENGNPIVGATLSLYDNQGNFVASTTTDSDGLYTFSDIPYGMFTIKSSADGYEDANSAVYVDDSGYDAQPFSLYPVTLRLKMKFEDSNGTPLEGVTGIITLNSERITYEATSDSTGIANFERQNIPAGTYDVLIQKDGYPDKTVTVSVNEKGTTTETVILRKQGEASNDITDAEVAIQSDPYQFDQYAKIGNLFQSKGDKSIHIFVNGKIPVFDVNPYFKNNRTMVPLRAIAESLGATVTWNSSDNTVLIQKGTHAVKLSLSTSAAQADGQSVTLDAPAEVKNERTMVPLRFVSETLNADVKWFPQGNVIAIVEKKEGA